MDLSRRTLLAATAGAAVAGPVLAAGPAAAVPTIGRTIASKLDIPWGLDFLPDGSALFTERDRARVSRVTPDGTVTVIGTIPGVVPRGEAGLLGLAVSPSYAQDHRIYLYQSTRDDNRVGWVSFDGTTLGRFQPIVTGIPVADHHNGGSLLFTGSGDGLLVGTGDAENRSAAQSLTSLSGKVLRVDRDGRARPTNPFVDRDGNDRIYSYGHRNPEGLATNTQREVWSAEFGENTWDELNEIERGRNYGWPYAEGSDGPGGYTDPLTQWHPRDCAPSGIAILAKRAWIGALRGECLWRVHLHGPQRGARARFFHGAFGRIRNVKVAPDRTLWITTSNGNGADKIVQIRP